MIIRSLSASLTLSWSHCSRCRQNGPYLVNAKSCLVPSIGTVEKIVLPEFYFAFARTWTSLIANGNYDTIRTKRERNESELPSQQKKESSAAG
mmetsp:Transcript_48859/g.147223  ORF Transcript_48859/g.147223 Transcript_48859/m.147223 type:complete len:93 (+) Transcript_48859:494-772(+)